MHFSDKLVGIGLALVINGKLMLRTAKNALRKKFPALFPTTENEAGDVPGWVLITLMSAILVTGLLALAGPALERLFNQAMSQVNP